MQIAQGYLEGVDFIQKPGKTQQNKAGNTRMRVLCRGTTVLKA
jgi:hypothetical protein